MHHLVCIISDQAVPNLLFIRQFAQPDSEFFFITTEQMESRQATDHMVRALTLNPTVCQRIIIDANDATLIQTQLHSFPFPKDAQYLINTTGGNKLMSQMVFSHFQAFDAKMLYAPINAEHYQQVYPNVLKIAMDTTIKLSIDQYLYAYGFEITGELPYFKGIPKPTSLFNKVIEKGGAGNVTEIKKAIHPDYKEADKNYLLGGWFEFYCYQFFKRVFKLNDSQIGCSIGLKKIGSITNNPHDNEFDLMFLYKNDLYVFECKVYTSPTYRKEKFHTPMFKLASLTQKFGLNCKKYLAILADLPESEENRDQLEQLRGNLGIDKVITLEDFRKYTDSEIFTVQTTPQLSITEKINLLKEKFNR